jgi:hypothetical protein
MVVYQLGLPKNATALRWFVSSLHADSVGIGTDYDDEIGLLDFTVHPHRPAVGRGWIVLIEHGVDAVLPETVGQSANAVLMGTRIMAVADEYPGSGLLCFLRSHSNDVVIISQARRRPRFGPVNIG